MEDLKSKLHWCNGMVLLSAAETEPDGDDEQMLLPCKKALALTPWKRQRDEILFPFLSDHLLWLHQKSAPQPVLIFANSVVEVNLLTNSLRSQIPSIDETEILAIGTNFSISDLGSKLSASSSTKVFILSAQTALAAFVHGFLQIQNFSLLCFADARGANQNHPFCIIMNHFYTPKSRAAGIRVIGFTEEPKNVELDMFTKRDWIRTLKHYTHTFHCVPMSLDPQNCFLPGYLESFESLSISPLFDPLSIYEAAFVDQSVPRGYPIIKELNIQNINLDSSNVLVLDHDTRIEEIPQFIAFLMDLKASFPQLTKLLHCRHPNSPQFSAQLSLQVALRNLSAASQAPSNQLDPQISNTLCKDAASLFSQSEHFLSFADEAQKRIVRNPRTGSLLIESTAIPTLVRACTLLSRQFRQSSANETVKFKTLRVFPVDSTGQKKLSSHPKHLSLLSLPKFMYEKIKEEALVRLHSTIEGFHLQGPLVMSRHQAQCCVAFEAVRLLMAAGILDDNLLLSSEYRKLEEDGDDYIDESIDAIIEEDSSASSSDSSLSFNELIPDSLILKNKKQLFIYAIEYELRMQGTLDDPLALDSDPIILTPYSRLLLQSCPTVDFFSVSKSTRTWAVILPSKLPETFVPTEIPIGADHFLRTELRFMGELERDTLEYEKLVKAQQGLFGMFNMKPITVPESGTRALNDSSPQLSIVPENLMPFYLIAPVTSQNNSDELTDLQSIPEVYKLFRNFVESFKSSPLDGVNYFANSHEMMPRDWKIDWKLIESDVNAGLKLSEYIEALDQISDSSSVQLEEGGALIDFKRFALERLAFFTPHTRIFYRLNHRSVHEPIYPSSPFSSSSYPMASTHAQYVAARYSLNVSQGEMEKEMVAVKRIENWSDLAVWISDDGATKKRRKKSSSSTVNSGGNSNTPSSTPGPSLIIPEFTRIFPASYATFRVSMLLPRVTAEIERQLRISQFFSDRLPASLPRPSHCRQVEALTASTAALSYSYEQLEVLGDSFLKYYSTLDSLLVGAGWSEGRLSSHRQRILCNANLRRAAEELQVTSYASFTPFFSKLWSPPPLIPQLPAPETSLDSAVSRVLFAPEERWRLLAEVEGKQTQRQVVYRIDPAGNLTVMDDYKTKEQAKNSTDALFKYGQLIPPKSLADILEALIGIYYIDCGVQGALNFLIHCKILRPDILDIRRLDPLRVLIGSEAVSCELIDKLKRRKLTPMNKIVLDHLDHNSNSNSNNKDHVELTLVKATQSIDVSIGQKIQNVLPYAPPSSQFPFDPLESSLGHVFNYRELLFMACTHCSVDAKLNNELLEWIGDAAIDWLVARHYWYNYRLDGRGNRVTSPLPRDQVVNLLHSAAPHVPVGFLPLSPESLTNSRQSAINNDTFARLVVRFGLHRFLRINSPHLQIEIERFGNEFRDPSAVSSACVVNRVPLSLDQLHTHVSVAAPKVLGDLFEGLMGAILLDSHFDIDGRFSDSFVPFLTAICSDPSDLPTNAIQETLHLYARLGIPRHQIVYTYKEISRDASLGVNCQVWVRERCVAEAEGSNKVVAKKLAMERALYELTNNPISHTW